MRGLIIASVVALLCLNPVKAFPAPINQAGISVTRVPGGSVKTESPKAYGGFVNPGSTLQREFVVLHDPALPVDLHDSNGVTTDFSGMASNGRYYFNISPKATARESVTALRITYLLFDIWGNRMMTVSKDLVKDMAPGEYELVDLSWEADSENDVRIYKASFAFISRVRTQSGQVIEANMPAVFAEFKKLSDRLTLGDLVADTK